MTYIELQDIPKRRLGDGNYYERLKKAGADATIVRDAMKKYIGASPRVYWCSRHCLCCCVVAGFYSFKLFAQPF